MIVTHSPLSQNQQYPKILAGVYTYDYKTIWSTYQGIKKLKRH